MSNVYLKHSSDKSAWPNIPGVATVVDGSDTFNDPDTAFDSAMRDLAGPGVAVFIGPGLWLTRGACGNSQAQGDAPGWRLQSGSRLIGAGKQGHALGGTTLRLVASNAQYGGLVVGANRYEADGVTPTNATGIHVSDMELDCNAPGIILVPKPISPWYLQGIQLTSAGDSSIERVHVINACAFGENGKAPEVENFTLCINSNADSIGNVISDCSVSDFYNPTGQGCCSAISLNCWAKGNGTISGEIVDCSVELNGERGWGFGGEFAYNLAYGKDVLIARCRSRGAQRGFNNDTNSNVGLVMENNIFDMPPGICVGFYLTVSNQGSRFTENTVILRGAGSSGFLIKKDTGGNKLTLTGNKVVAVGSWLGSAFGFNLNDGLKGLSIPTEVEFLGNSTQGTSGARIDNLVSADVGYMDGNTADGQTWFWPVSMQPNKGWPFKEEA